MASVVSDPGGFKRIMFFDRHGKRWAVRLGKVSERQALHVKLKIEDLVAAGIQGGAPKDETARWVAELDPVLRARLARTHLVAGRDVATLADFIDAYVGTRKDVKGATRLVYGRTRKHLVDHFGAEKPVASFTTADADAFQTYLLGRLALNTTRRTIGYCKQFFDAAQRQGLVTCNPFEDQKASVVRVEDKFHYVTRQDTDRLLEVCPDAQWRLLIVLARYGGLRVPSEPLALTWDCVDWEQMRLRVVSPKTAHHAGGDYRMIPMFPELVEPLRQVFEEAEVGSRYVITRYRTKVDNYNNLSTHLKRLIRRARLTVWPKPWVNMRSSRSIELNDEYPGHVAARWLGHSPQTAAKHYLNTRDDHFTRAVTTTYHPAQNPAQYLQESTGNHGKAVPDDAGGSAVSSDAFRGLPNTSDMLQDDPLGDTGLEPVTSCMSSKRSSQLS